MGGVGKQAKDGHSVNPLLQTELPRVHMQCACPGTAAVGHSIVMCMLRHCLQHKCCRTAAPAHAPSVRRALPPVGTHSTVLQLGHTTTVWLWLNTVVLQQGQRGERDKRGRLRQGGGRSPQVPFKLPAAAKLPLPLPEG